MNRTDRLLAILLELQSKGRLRAEDLAATFSVSRRSIYRDLEALCEAQGDTMAKPSPVPTSRSSRDLTVEYPPFSRAAS